MSVEITDRELDVIMAMRESARAEKAIYNYATKFAGDDEAFTPADAGEAYRDSYGEP